MDYVFAFNVVETVLWTAIGAYTAKQAFYRGDKQSGKERGKGRYQLFAISVLFFVFAGSEVVESQTGAWWRPWWLAVWKGVCIAGIAGLVVTHRRWYR